MHTNKHAQHTHSFCEQTHKHFIEKKPSKTVDFQEMKTLKTFYWALYLPQTKSDEIIVHFFFKPTDRCEWWPIALTFDEFKWIQGFWPGKKTQKGPCIVSHTHHTHTHVSLHTHLLKTHQMNEMNAKGVALIIRSTRLVVFVLNFLCTIMV